MPIALKIVKIIMWCSVTYATIRLINKNHNTDHEEAPYVILTALFGFTASIAIFTGNYVRSKAGKVNITSIICYVIGAIYIMVNFTQLI